MFSRFSLFSGCPISESVISTLFSHAFFCTGPNVLLGGFNEADGGKVIQLAMVKGINKELNIPALTDSIFKLTPIAHHQRVASWYRRDST